MSPIKPQTTPGSLGNWIHLCVDMQRIFSEPTPWHVPWMARVSPEVVELAGRFPARNIFTRFITPVSADAVPGMWKVYYDKWTDMTRERLPRGLLGLVPELTALVPPGRIFDKMTYSPWVDGRLHRLLQRDAVATLVITGGETGVCVLAAVLGAIDLGYRVIIARDAICSADDDTHDASLALLENRFSVQLTLKTTDEILRLLS